MVAVVTGTVMEGARNMGIATEVKVMAIAMVLRRVNMRIPLRLSP